MAATNTHLKTHKVTATLTSEEYELLEAFAAEQGIENVGEAVPALLHELVRLHDQAWDAQFAQPTDKPNALARKALDHHQAGLTEDFDEPTP